MSCSICSIKSARYPDILWWVKRFMRNRLVGKLSIRKLIRFLVLQSFNQVNLLFILQGFSTPGIGFIAETMQLKACSKAEWKMCNFLKLHIGDTLDMKYVGQMLPHQVTMITRDRNRFKLGKGITFYGNQVISKIDSSKGGDRLSFEAEVLLTRTNDRFPGKISLITLVIQ